MNYSIKVALFTIILLLITVITNGQIQYKNIRFKQLETTDGLSHNTVNTITQDRDGFMWFGTRNGLCKYDGYSIKTYYHDNSDTTSICHDFIYKIYNDSILNGIWISTDNGICFYDINKTYFKKYTIPKNKRNDIKFLLTSTKELLATSSNGIYYFNKNKKRFLPFIANENSNINNLYEDKSNVLWIETNKGITCYDLKDKKIIHLPLTLQMLQGKKNSVKYLENDILLFVCKNKLYLYNISSDKLINITKKQQDTNYRCAEVDSNGNIWIGSEYGINVFSPQGKLIAHYEQSNNDLSALNDSPIYSIFRDKSNNIWIGTYFGGINYYIYETDKFRIYPMGTSSNNLSGKAVRQITTDGKKGIYIATEDGGLNHLDSIGNILRSDKLHSKIGINSKNIHSVYFDNHNLWIGLFLKGVIKYNIPQNKALNYYKNSEKNCSGFCIEKDGENNIWYGGPSGLFKIIVKNDSVIKISSIPTFTILKLNNKTLLIGSRKNGIFEIETTNNNINKIENKLIQELYITYLYSDQHKNIWIGTNNNGLFIMNKHKKIIRHYTQNDIGSNSIKGIIEDNQGKIWVGTDNGLVCIERDKSYRYTVADGLPTNQFNYSSAFKKTSGELYFGTINGMISFYPSMVKPKSPQFNVSFTNLWINNKLVSPSDPQSCIPDNINKTKKITLSYTQAQGIRLEYSGMNFKYTDNTQYAMFMEGLDKDWQFIGNQNQVRFTNLPAGNYILKIKASHDGINWDEKGIKTLNIKILPPWWLSNWAYTIYIMLLITILVTVYKYTKARIELKMRLKSEHAQRINIEKLNKQKTDFFTYISHDLKTPLTLILSPLQKLITQNEISDKDKKNIETIYRNANRMHYLIDEILTFSKIEMNQMHITVRKGNIISFLGEISQIFDIVSKEKEIDFILNLEDNGKEVWFSPSKLERIMYNLLSNAFKYSQAGDTVTLSAHLKEENDSTYAVILVKDTGRGIPKEMLDKIFESYYQVEKKDHREGFGLGLSLTRSLIQMHKGDIKVESEVGVGTIFTVTLNVSDNAYTKDEKAIESISQDEIKKYNQRMRDTIELVPEKLVDEEKKNDKETIMIVEDNKEMNEYICDIFKDKYNVMRAFNGEEAYKMLSKRIPDIIVSDIMMPKVDGLEFTRLVKQDVSTSHIPVILLTAKTDEKDHTEGYKCGAEAYIAKPFNAQNLELLIENIQNNRRKVIERFKQAEEMNVTQVTNNPRDEKFMKELVDLIMKNISQEDFGVTEITAELHISRSLLHTKLKSLTGCSITQFMRTIRMKEARTHLMNGMNVSEASYAVGMSDPNYFTKCFKKEFDITPSEFLKQITAESNKQ